MAAASATPARPPRRRPAAARRPAPVPEPAATLLREIVALYRQAKALPASDRRALEDQISERARRFWTLIDL